MEIGELIARLESVRKQYDDKVEISFGEDTYVAIVYTPTGTSSIFIAHWSENEEKWL